MKKCLIWGTGHAATNWIKNMKNVDIMAFVSSNPQSTVFRFQCNGRTEEKKILHLCPLIWI